MHKFVVVITDAWEQLTATVIKAASLNEAFKSADNILTELNAKDDSPLYQIEGVMSEALFKASIADFVSVTNG